MQYAAAFQKNFPLVYKIRHISGVVPHIVVCMPAKQAGSRGNIKTEESPMDDNTVRTITPEEAQRAPRDLDDLIFQGEPWWVSDR